MRISARAIVHKGDEYLVMKRNKFGNEFYALIGGGVEPGEVPAKTVIREVLEESSLVVANPRLVILEHAGNVFGDQYIFLCEYVSGEPKLNELSEEFGINQMGKNLYTPTWIKIVDLEGINLLPGELHHELVNSIKVGYADAPKEIFITS